MGLLPSPRSSVPSFGSRFTRWRGTFWYGAYSTWHLQGACMNYGLCITARSAQQAFLTAVQAVDNFSTTACECKPT